MSRKDSPVTRSMPARVSWGQHKQFLRFTRVFFLFPYLCSLWAVHSGHRDGVSNVSLLPPLWRQIVLCGAQARLELSALLSSRYQGIRCAEGQGLKLSWYSSKVSFYFGIGYSLIIPFVCKPQNRLSFHGAGTAEQEMALLLVADNPVQLRPFPQGFLKAHSPQIIAWALASFLFIHKPGANKHHLHFFFPMLLWLSGKKMSFWCLFKKIA